MRHLPMLLAGFALPLAACSAPAPAPDPTPAPTASEGAAASPNASGTDGADYQNDRFDFALEVPSGFVAAQAPANDDGRVFRNGDAELRIFGSNNALGRSFTEQIAAAREGLEEVEVQARRDGYFRATARDPGAGRVHLLLLRPDEKRLVTTRFSYPDPGREQWRQVASHTLNSVALVARAGPASLRYDPARHAAASTELQLPPSYDEQLPATKLIARDRVAQLGQQACRYGLSGEVQTCEAAMETGIAIAVSDTPVARYRSRFPSADIEPSNLAGRTGFRVAHGAEGSGAIYSFLPAGNRTVIVQQLYRETGEPTQAMSRLLDTLRIARVSSR